ncbi:hypothetical protein [Thomasclavelia cocleata]|uniref:hypothetical protein n=1 Tax=Thomasclavelia cocleata TaxID=69824 RepID=UPI00255B34A5|nr:hypothetical protein [Thomasclavelia cocleata]
MKINKQNYTGLTSNQVKQRINEGKLNIIDNKITKSYKQIFLNNIITFFNILNAALLALVIFVGFLQKYFIYISNYYKYYCRYLSGNKS